MSVKRMAGSTVSRSQERGILLRKLRIVAATQVVTMAASVAGIAPALAATEAWNCKNIGNGDLCIRGSAIGYDARYYKRTGNNVAVRFKLAFGSGRSRWDDGASTAVAGRVLSCGFGVGRQGTCRAQPWNGSTLVVTSYSITW